MGEPTFLTGPGALRAAVAAYAGPAVAIVDGRVAETGAGRAALADLRSSARFAVIRAQEHPAPASVLAELAADHPGTGVVVGIGGGSVIDQAKLLAGLLRRADTARFLTIAQRAGWTSLRGSAERDVGLALLPTTLGTGAEMSRVACLDGPDGKQLVEGEILRADIAVVDAGATATLPGALVMEGVFEAWSRTMGALAGASSSAPSEDALATGLAVRLTQLGDAAHAALDAGHPVDAGARLEIARLSAMSHSHWLHLGRPPFAYKAWFLATELAGHAAARKVPALAAVLPAIWREIAAGEGVLGDAGALARAWDAVRGAADGELPDQPAEGLTELLRAWGLAEEPVEAGDPEAVARSALRRWGAGLPMLSGAGAPLLTRIFTSQKQNSTGAPPSVRSSLCRADPG